MTKQKIITSEFKAPWWAKNRHVQTVFPRFFQRRKPLSTRIERVELPDGDFINLVWAEAKAQFSPKGLMILFHGLEGSIHSHYANDFMAHCLSQGWQPVLMHFRGCGGVLNLTTRAYHSGETKDAIFILEKLKRKFPDLPRIATGFSLGGNMLLKLLGENPNQRLLNAAVAISAPLKLEECAKSINNGLSRFYQKFLLNSMRNTLIAKMKLIDYTKAMQLKQEQINTISTFREFDEKVTAPINGFSNADHYYQQCSASGYLKLINTPTLVLHSKDDPFMNEKVVPQHDELSEHVLFELSENGGHVGFLMGTPWRPTIWFHQRVLKFAEQHI